MAYARHVAALDAPQGDGTTWRAHLLERRRKARSPEAREAVEREILGPEFPESLAYLWRWFLRLAPMRGASLNGPERFTPPYIESAARLFGWPILPHEAEALADLDLAYLAARAEAAA